MIEGINIRCNVGSFELLRSPFIELAYKRRSVVTRCVIHIPDPAGNVRTNLSIDDIIKVRFGYRGNKNYWHEWKGTVSKIDQPRKDASNADVLIIQGVGIEKALVTTTITETFCNEMASAVARQLLAKTGLPVSSVSIPDNLIPHQIFSNISIASAIKQLEQTLKRAFGYDLSEHALWYGKDGLTWSSSDEPGAVYCIETANNLINHTPPVSRGEMGVVTSVLLPGLIDSRKVRIRDHRRQITAIVRAEEVIHTLQANGNSTAVFYGKNSGWGG